MLVDLFRFIPGYRGVIFRVGIFTGFPPISSPDVDSTDEGDVGPKPKGDCVAGDLNV
jgi:hypothetical protein